MNTYRVGLRGEDLLINPLHNPSRIVGGKVLQYKVFPGTPALEAFLVDVDAESEEEALELARTELEFARLNYTFS